MSITNVQPQFELNILGYPRVVDCSPLPVEVVAREAPWKLLALPPMILRHPDLWHDGRWVDKP